MSGENKVISGVKNKMMVGMLNSMPDSANAANMQKNMKPSDKPAAKRKRNSRHGPSQLEREAIEKDRSEP